LSKLPYEVQFAALPVLTFVPYGFWYTSAIFKQDFVVHCIWHMSEVISTLTFEAHILWYMFEVIAKATYEGHGIWYLFAVFPKPTRSTVSGTCLKTSPRSSLRPTASVVEVISKLPLEVLIFSNMFEVISKPTWMLLGIWYMFAGFPTMFEGISKLTGLSAAAQIQKDNAAKQVVGTLWLSSACGLHRPSTQEHREDWPKAISC